MPRTVAYILLTKSGPSQEDQLATIRKAKLPIAPCYVDDLTKRRALDKREFPERVLMLKQMRPGDMVAVASPGRLGMGKDDVLDVLRALAAKSGAVIDASTGHELRWTPEVADAYAFLDGAITEHKQLAAWAARRAKATERALNGPRLKPFLLSEAEVKRRWHNQVDYPSQKAVAEASGKSVRSLYGLFGPRGGLKNARRKKS